MKKILTLLTLTLVGQAFAGVPGWNPGRGRPTPIKPIDVQEKTAKLTEIRMDEQRESAIVSAEITVSEKEVTLTLVPAGVKCIVAPCPQFEPEVITLPVVERSENCGSKVVTARHDGRPYDGLFQEIIVQDHTTRLCEDYRPYATEVTLNEKGSWVPFERTSYLAGERLSSVNGSTIEEAVLDAIELDPSLNTRFPWGVETAQVSTDDATVTLTINSDSPVCAAVVGQECPGPSEALVVTLPVISKEETDCGVTNIIAIQDDRPVDGVMQKILITDYRNLTCRIHVKDKTKVVYETAFYNRLKGNEVKTKSTFAGEALRIVR